MKEKEIKNQPLMFIETIQKLDDKNKSQLVYDSRLKKKKDKKE